MVDPVRPLTPHMEKPSSLLKGSFTHKELLMMRENPEVPFLKKLPSPLLSVLREKHRGEVHFRHDPGMPWSLPMRGFPGLCPQAPAGAWRHV